MNQPMPEYVGFWARVGAAFVDGILMGLVLYPVVRALGGGYDWDDLDSPRNIFLNGVLPAIVILLFWNYRQATPGKMLIGAKVVDAKTLGPASTNQLILRYIGYYVSIIPLCLGLFWVGIDPRKQGFHDKLANTVVIRAR